MAPMILLIFFFNFAFANHPTSAVRLPQEDYKKYFYHPPIHGSKQFNSAQDLASDLGDEPWQTLPMTLLTASQLQKIFDGLYDYRPAVDQNGFARRLTWRYPDDGCYARSAIMQSRLRAGGINLFQQIFVFGNLIAASDDHPARQVYWWYHVAPVVRTQEGFFVLDPTLNSRGPLTLNSWLGRMIQYRGEVKVSLCSPATYLPSSDCQAKTPIEYARAMDEFKNTYFGLEWARLEYLGKDPKQELGLWRLQPSNQDLTTY